MGITPKQKKLLDFVDAYQKKNGYAPTQTEIASNFGYRSLGTVQNYLTRLEREGMLSKPWNAKRGLEVKVQAIQAENILPLSGRVAAGRPIEAVESLESIEVPAGMIKRGHQHFVLEVKGDSMIGDGILEGDYVVIRKQAGAQNGETVVALINGEATIKRFQKKKDLVQLIAANPAYPPIEVPPGEDFQILGVLSGLIRMS
jgi:repressor LexA